MWRKTWYFGKSAGQGLHQGFYEVYHPRVVGGYVTWTTVGVCITMVTVKAGTFTRDDWNLSETIVKDRDLKFQVEIVKIYIEVYCRGQETLLIIFKHACAL